MSTSQPTPSGTSSLAPPPNAGPLTLSIHTKLLTLHPTHLRILNDSHKHAHHEAMSSLSTPVAERETHLRVEIVSEEFGGRRMAARHRMVYALCREEMEAEGGVHALQISARTGEEDALRR